MNPGSVLNFHARFANIAPGATPDEFTFAILDQNLNEIPMLGGNGSMVND